jgi:hypothetical protein
MRRDSPPATSHPVDDAFIVGGLSMRETIHDGPTLRKSAITARKSSKKRSHFQRKNQISDQLFNTKTITQPFTLPTVKQQYEYFR